MLRTLLIAAITSLVSLTACSSSPDAPDHDAFDTYQMCWDEHHTTEAFDVQKSIVICCIDHPIGTADMNVVCGNTAADCTTYVDANLASTDATANDIDTACADYITQRGM